MIDRVLKTLLFLQIPYICETIPFKKKFSEQAGSSCLQMFCKKGSSTAVFQWILQNTKNIFFTKHLRATASEQKIPESLTIFHY